MRARGHRSNSCVRSDPHTSLPMEHHMRRAGGGRLRVNSTRTKRNRRAPTRIDAKENSLRPFSSGARGREFESPRSDQLNQSPTNCYPGERPRNRPRNVPQMVVARIGLAGLGFLAPMSTQHSSALFASRSRSANSGDARHNVSRRVETKQRANPDCCAPHYTSWRADLPYGSKECGERW